MRDVPRSLRNLASMLDANVPPAHALRGVSASDDEPKLERAADLVDRGLSLASALEHERAFPETALRFIRLGEEDGQTVARMREAAEKLAPGPSLAEENPALVGALVAGALGALALALWHLGRREPAASDC